MERGSSAPGEAQEVGCRLLCMYYMGSGLQSENNLLFLLFPLKWCFWKKKKKKKQAVAWWMVLSWRREIGNQNGMWT